MQNWQVYERPNKFEIPENIWRPVNYHYYYYFYQIELEILGLFDIRPKSIELPNNYTKLSEN